MTLKYRPEIDGLRAVAVLAVIFFHMDLCCTNGGFVGVDIFFVISGYLISSIIIHQVSEKTFSLSSFFRHRLRRILPTLFVMTLTTLIVGLFLLPPNLLKKLGDSAIYAALFLSNIYFYHQSGYFDIASSLKPLLHTWSLGVEEQYYLLFPLLITYLALSKKWNMKPVISIIFLISLSLSYLLTITDQSFAFYLLPTRIWEFFIGVLLSMRIFLDDRFSYFSNPLIGYLGFFLIVLSIIFFKESMSFPGIWGLIPVLGTAMILYTSEAKEKAPISSILSYKPIVHIGKISYSLYLWHWPILVYSKIYFLGKIPLIVSLFLFISLFPLSHLSWKYIETPFRRENTYLQKRWGTFKTSILFIGVILIVGLSFKITNGFDSRFCYNEALQSKRDWGKCEDKFLENGTPCIIGSPKNTPSFILWGDSHARALAEGVDGMASKHGKTGVLATQSSCPPLLGVDRQGRTTCNEFNEKVVNYIRNHPNIKTIILAARWPLSWKGTRYGEEEGKNVQLVDLSSPQSSMNNIVLFKKGLLTTVHHLMDLNRSIELVSPIPEIGFNVPSIQPVIQLRHLKPKNYAPTYKEYLKRSKDLIEWFHTLEKKYKNLRILNPTNYLLHDSHILLFKNGKTLYKDDDHLSPYGSRYVAKVFESIFR